MLTVAYAPLAVFLCAALFFFCRLGRAVPCRAVCAVYIRYFFQGWLHEVILDDDEPGTLPHPSHRIRDGEFLFNPAAYPTTTGARAATDAGAAAAAE